MLSDGQGLQPDLGGAGFHNSKGAPIEPEHLPLERLEQGQPSASRAVKNSEPRNEHKRRYVASGDSPEERQNIVTALIMSGGNKKRAAQHLGRSRQLLWERIRLYGIDPTEWTRVTRSDVLEWVTKEPRCPSHCASNESRTLSRYSINATHQRPPSCNDSCGRATCSFSIRTTCHLIRKPATY